MNFRQISDQLATVIAEDLLAVRAALMDHENAEKYGRNDASYLAKVALDVEAVAILAVELARRRDVAFDAGLITEQ